MFQRAFAQTPKDCLSVQSEPKKRMTSARPTQNYSQTLRNVPENAKNYPAYNSTWIEKPSELNKAARSFYDLGAVTQLQSRLEKEHQRGEDLRKKILSLKRGGKGPVMVTGQHQHYFTSENLHESKASSMKPVESIARPF